MLGLAVATSLAPTKTHSRPVDLLKIVVVTGTQPHHKNLCSVIARSHQVVGIIHPRQRKTGSIERVWRLVRRAKSNGWGTVAAEALGRVCTYARRSAANDKSENRTQFADGVQTYEQICKPLAH